MRRLALVIALVASAGCGSKRDATPVPPAPHDAASAVADAAPVAVAPRPLGLSDLAAWQWRERAGHPAVLEARAAVARGDWTGVAAACERAVAADPTHLEASWLRAIAAAKLGRMGEILAPLQVAAAGDLGKWGLASLEHPALQPFLATPQGRAWRQRVETDRTALVTTLAQSLIVIAAGDLFAYDAAGTRWYRLTRTNGAVVAALRSSAGAPQILYVARRAARQHGVGVVDLATGKTFQPLGIGAATGLELGFDPQHQAWIAARQPAKRPGVAWLVHEKHRLQPGRAAPGGGRPKGTWLAYSESASAVLHRRPDGIAADWDELGFASAIRVASTARVLTVAGQIDGASIVWSPDHAQLAFMAALQDATEACALGAPAIAAHVADAGTGMVRALATSAQGLAVEWLADGRVALADADGVTVVAADGTRTPVIGATGLLTPRRAPLCRAVEAGAPMGDVASDGGAVSAGSGGEPPRDGGIADGGAGPGPSGEALSPEPEPEAAPVDVESAGRSALPAGRPAAPR